MDRFEEKREKFRFPLFDDAEPVKLPEEKPRHLFQNQESFDVNTDESISKSSTVTETEVSDKEDTNRDDDLVTLQNETSEKFDFSYQGPPMEKPIIEMKKPIFYNDHHVSFEEKKKVDNSHHKPNFKAEIIEEKLERKSSKLPSYVEDEQYRPVARHHFVPRKIPSQIVKHTPKDSVEKIESKEILERLKKPTSSYMSFDLEATTIYKESDDVTIEHSTTSDFLSDIPGIFDEVPIVSDPVSDDEKAEEIPLTRQEFKKLSKKGDVDLPAITKKQQKETKTSRLDRGLGSIIEEQLASNKKSQYFDF
ncbi:hypothetical protein OL233_00795 [Vagococcus sp. PNs007]|uniref:Uncharacterized protein n=1 Tax=Vagococcus proximus TaxID=2991417 RepID=A0ABT5WYH6_9ENTE|nr:hypothetical protein [Vagococcus proximus]MDF0478810.1 hypothetical protein [Vagococcus proximus]